MKTRLVIAACTLAVVACGGDGTALSGPNEPPPPAAPLSATLEPGKALAFSWPAVAQATHFELVEDPDGDAGPQSDRVVASLPAGALSYRLDNVLLVDLQHATFWLRTCIATACSTSDPVVLGAASLNAAITYFKSSNRTGAGDGFGVGVALSGDGRFMASGAPAENQLVNGINPVFTGVTAERVGAVYTFERDGTGWRQDSYIKADTARAFSEFGVSIALSNDGRVMVVGAHRDRDVANDSGSVYFFRRQPGGEWVQEAVFKAAIPQAGAFLGASVVLSGNGEWAAASQSGAANGGEVLVYRFVEGSGWIPVQTLAGNNTQAGDLFGHTLSMSDDGQVIVVGAPSEASSTAGGPSDNSLQGAGASYIFQQTIPGVWTESVMLKASAARQFARYGSSVVVSGNGSRVAVGGPDFGAVAGTPPYVEVFDLVAGSWTRSARLEAIANSPNTEFGRGELAMSADGTLLLVGAHLEDGNGVGLGGYLDAEGGQDSGAVFVYRRDISGVWSSPGYVKASNSRVGLGFGNTLAISDDGRTLAVSAPQDSSGATGIQGDQSDTSATNAGAVYLY